MSDYSILDYLRGFCVLLGLVRQEVIIQPARRRRQTLRVRR